MRLMITGAAGLLGTEVCRVAAERAHDVVAARRAALDVTDRRAVERAVERAEPEAIVQCAAYTAVDGAESEPELAMAVNRDGTRFVAEAARSVGARLAYVSTDYVFDGAQRVRPYRPDDSTNPLSAYARTKLEGERAALDGSPGALVARTSWVYGGARPNFLTSMLDRAGRGGLLRVVDDQFGGPSWSRSVAATLLDLLERGAEGVWHAADKGVCNRFELVREATRLAGYDTEILPVPAAHFGGAAERPSYSPLDVSATEALLGRSMPRWQDSLAVFVSEHLRPEGPLRAAVHGTEVQ